MEDEFDSGDNTIEEEKEQKEPLPEFPPNRGEDGK